MTVLAPAAPRSLSVRWHLVLYSVALALPILLFTGFVLIRFATTERTRIENEATQKANAIAAAIDRDLISVTTALDLLSLSAYLKADDLAGFRQQALEVQTKLGLSPVLRTPDGQQLVNAAYPADMPLPRTPLPDDAAAMSTRATQYSNVFIGQISHQPLASVMEPIVRDGRVVYLLSISLMSNRLRQTLVADNPPPTWTVALIDTAGAIMARNNRQEEFVGKQASADLLANTTGDGGTWRGTTVDGQAIFGTYARSRLSGWRVAVGVRSVDFDAPVVRSIWLLIALGVVLALLSALLASVFARRITDPILALSARAAAVGRGEVMPPLQTRLREAQEVDTDLQAAAERLAERARERDAAIASLAGETDRLRLSEGRFRAAVQAVNGILWTNDAEGRMHGDQYGWSLLTGQTRAEYEGYGWASAVHPDDAQPTVEAWQKAVEARDTFVFEHRVRRRDGAWRIYAIRAVPIMDEGGNLREWVGVHTDITEQRDAEADLRESNEEIQRYAYIVSHDLRAPLVNIVGFTSELETLRNDLLRAGTQPEESPERMVTLKEFDESIGYIKAAIQKMDGLINAILRLSREGRRTFRPEPLDMTSLVKGLTDAQRHQADTANVEVTVEELPEIVADRLATEQIFGNLLDNAIKYLDESRPGRIAISARDLGSRVAFTVEDNGRGIAPQDHARIFELFRRSGRQDRAGEGIGLAHVRTLVRTLGGRIYVVSELGKGSRFQVILPKSPQVGRATRG